MNPRVALLVCIALTVSLAGCGDKNDKPATQTAAKVNKEEITVHQVNALLQQQRGLKPEQADAAGRQALERLIDQELRLQKAEELKVHRDQQVVQAIESARREIVSRAYIDKIGEGAAKPTPAEIKAYYDTNPALFKERRVYQLQELAIEAAPSQIDILRTKLQVVKNLTEFVDFLNANNFKYAANQAVRAAEQLPLAALPSLAKMKDGQMMLNVTDSGAQVMLLSSSRTQAVDEVRASKAIEQFLLNERKRKIVADDLKALRSSAKIAYGGKYAASAPAAAEVETAPTAAEVAASATATIDNKSIVNGMGIKASTGVASAAEVTNAAVMPVSGIDASSISKGLGLK